MPLYLQMCADEKAAVQVQADDAAGAAGYADVRRSGNQCSEESR
jgi:hypothetical protein